MPEVSVIVPNFNHAQFLVRRIESVLNQTFMDFEVILLDDSSKDTSRIVLDSYKYHPKVSHIVYNETNSGSAFRQWNKGISLAKGRFIWIAESDDSADEHFLETLVPHLQADSEIAIAFCRSLVLDDEDKIQGVHQLADVLDADRWEYDYCIQGREEIRDCLSFLNTIPNASGVVFRKDVFLSIDSSLYQGMIFNGDWLVWGLMLKEHKVYYSSQALNHFRHHHYSTRNSFPSVRKEYRRLTEYLKVAHTMQRLSKGKTPKNPNIFVYSFNFYKSMSVVMLSFVKFLIKHKILRSYN